MSVVQSKIAETVFLLKQMREQANPKDETTLSCALDLLEDAFEAVPDEVGVGITDREFHLIATKLARPEWIVRERLDEAISDLCE